MNEFLWMLGFTICFMLVMFVIPIALGLLDSYLEDKRTEKIIDTINYKRRWKEKMSNGTLDIRR